MLRITCIFVLFALVGCGGGEPIGTDAGAGAAPEPQTGAPAGDSGESTPAVSAPAPAATEAATGAALEAATEAAPAAAAAPPVVQSCLDLVAQTQYAQAVPVCLEAQIIDPTNARVQAALDKAKAEAAGLDAASAAAAAKADAAVGEATGAAEGAIDDAAGAAKGALPRY